MADKVKTTNDLWAQVTKLKSQGATDTEIDAIFSSKNLPPIKSIEQAVVNKTPLKQVIHEYRFGQTLHGQVINYGLKTLAPELKKLPETILKAHTPNVGTKGNLVTRAAEAFVSPAKLLAGSKTVMAIEGRNPQVTESLLPAAGGIIGGLAPAPLRKYTIPALSGLGAKGAQLLRAQRGVSPVPEGTSLTQRIPFASSMFPPTPKREWTKDELSERPFAIPLKQFFQEPVTPMKDLLWEGTAAPIAGEALGQSLKGATKAIGATGKDLTKTTAWLNNAVPAVKRILERGTKALLPSKSETIQRVGMKIKNFLESKHNVVTKEYDKAFNDYEVLPTETRKVKANLGHLVGLFNSVKQDMGIILSKTPKGKDIITKSVGLVAGTKADRQTITGLMKSVFEGALKKSNYLSTALNKPLGVTEDIAKDIPLNLRDIHSLRQELRRFAIEAHRIGDSAMVKVYEKLQGGLTDILNSASSTLAKVDTKYSHVQDLMNDMKDILGLQTGLKAARASKRLSPEVAGKFEDAVKSLDALPSSTLDEFYRVIAKHSGGKFINKHLINLSTVGAFEGQALKPTAAFVSYITRNPIRAGIPAITMIAPTAKYLALWGHKGGKAVDAIVKASKTGVLQQSLRTPFSLFRGKQTKDLEREMSYNK